MQDFIREFQTQKSERNIPQSFLCVGTEPTLTRCGELNARRANYTRVPTTSTQDEDRDVDVDQNAYDVDDTRHERVAHQRRILS